MGFFLSKKGNSNMANKMVMLTGMYTVVTEIL